MSRAFSRFSHAWIRFIYRWSGRDPYEAIQANKPDVELWRNIGAKRPLTDKPNKL